MPLAPRSKTKYSQEQIDLLNQNGSVDLSSSFRRRTLRFFERAYFQGMRWQRRTLPMGKLLAGFAFAALVMMVDPTRISMRFVFAFIICLFITSWIRGIIVKPRNILMWRELPDTVEQSVPFDYTIFVKNESKRVIPSFVSRDNGKVYFPTLWDWYRFDAPFEKDLNFFDRFVGYPKWLYMVDQMQDAIGADFEVPTLGPGETISLKVKGVCANRGERLFLGFYCGLPDLFGLFRTLFFLRSAQSIIVMPKIIGGTLAVPSGSRTLQKGVAREMSKTGDSEEFRSLREWRSGDPLKKIDWKATARSGIPIAREYAPEYFLRTAVAVDNFVPHVSQKQAFEEVVSRASGYIMGADRKENKIDLLFMEDQVYHVALARGKEDHLKALKKLACLKESGTDRIEELELSVLNQASKFSGAVLILVQWDEARAKMCQRLSDAGIGLAIIMCGSTKVSGAPAGAKIQYLGDIE